MTPREIIKGNVKFTGADRIGMQFDNNRMNDFCGGGADTSLIFKEKRWVEGDFEYHDDMWGNVWYRIKYMSQGGEIFKPALEDWAMLKDYELPDLANPELYKQARETFSNDKEHYRSGWLMGFPFAICRYMRKMEIYLQDLILEREKVDKLHEMVTSLLEKMIIQFAEAGADGVFFCEDWGTQERLLISPKLWREIYKPVYKRLCDTAHNAGIDVVMHSCGYDWEIIDDLAEAGIDCLQFDQPELYGLERLSEKLQKLKVCLFSPVDIQKTIQTGDKTVIVARANEMVRRFFGKQGGFIAKNYGDLKGIGVDPEWDTWAYEAFLGHCGKKRA